MTIDYFDIKLDGAIAQLGGGAQNTLNLCYLTVQDASSDFCQAVHRNPAYGRRSRFRTRSMCCRRTSADWRPSASTWARVMDGMRASAWKARSRFDISTQWTFTDKFTITPMQAVPANKNRCVGAYGSTCGEPIPESKGVTRFTWTTGPLGVSLRHRFIDSVTTDRIVLPQTRRSHAAGWRRR